MDLERSGITMRYGILFDVAISCFIHVDVVSAGTLSITVQILQPSRNHPQRQKSWTPSEGRPLRQSLYDTCCRLLLTGHSADEDRQKPAPCAYRGYYIDPNRAS